MMKNSKRFLGILIAASLFALTGCGSSSTPAPAAPAPVTPAPAAPAKPADELKEKITIRFAHAFGPTSFLGKAVLDWAELVKKNSDGKIEVQVFPSGQLYNFQSLPEAVSNGTIDAGLNMTTYTTQILPEVGFWSLPSLFRDDADAAKVLESDVTKKVHDLFAKKDIEIVDYLPYGASQWYANRPLKLPSDMKGMKVRVNTDVLARAVEAMGGAAVFVEANEVYTGMQRKTIDGYMNGYSSLVDRKLYEVTTDGIDVNSGYIQSMISFNKGKWDKYPAAARKIIADAAKQTRLKTQKDLVVDEKSKLDQAIAKGFKLYKPTAEEAAKWRDAIRPAWDDYTKRTGATGKDLIDSVLKATGQK